ncbi:regulatory protein RecX [Ruania halotolerans]|uniref:regulatory protein RecX n=1 Tax=Ruania halotolerans TaxID=2897773 RepID=UPI001E2F0FCC|nr:regulatory protein RecX [Ruania halotolerans]UFU05156.1 recombination regulator RecX [Ruania halotolerans]
MKSARRRPSRVQEPPETGAAAEDAEPDPEQVARTIALRKLNAAPQSRAQLAEAMAKRDVPEPIIEKVLDRFTEVGLVDDVAYAEMLVRSKHNERGLARRALAQELRRKGIEGDVADGALEAVQPEDEHERARELVRRKARSTQGLEHQKRRRRLVSMLARKGYGPGVALSAVDEVLAEDSEIPALDELDARSSDGPGEFLDAP